MGGCSQSVHQQSSARPSTPTVKRRRPPIGREIVVFGLGPSVHPHCRLSFTEFRWTVGGLYCITYCTIHTLTNKNKNSSALTFTASHF